MSMSITRGVAIAQIKALGADATFYASELGICGGTINGLAMSNYIEKTGKTRKVMVNLYDDIFKACEVYEWRVTKWGANSWEINEYKKMLFDAYEALKSLGY